MYDAVVIGGSAAGLAASLALGRSLLSVLCIDAGLPCNRFAHKSYNFLSHDGESPGDILAAGRRDVEQYKTVEFQKGQVTGASEQNGVFTITTNTGPVTAKTVLIASGVSDEMSQFGNVQQFWGNSIIHCPFCHGYEHANGKMGLYYDSAGLLSHQVPMLYNWSKQMRIFTSEQTVQALDASISDKITKLDIPVYTSKIVRAEGEGSQLAKVVLESGEEVSLDVLYMEATGALNNKDIIEKLGVELENGLIKVNPFQSTNVPGVFAAGDCTTKMRQIAQGVYQGGIAGAMMAIQTAKNNWDHL